MSITLKYIQTQVAKLTAEFSAIEQPSYTELDSYWQQLNTIQGLSQIQIERLDYLGSPDPLDESITLRNRGPLAVDISGWRIQAGSPNQEFIFPKQSLLQPFAELSVLTSSKGESGEGQYSFNSNQPVWNNHGDLATLLDDQQRLISSWAYRNLAHPWVSISHIHYDGAEFRSEGDEYIEITNTSGHRIDISGWMVRSASNNQHYQFAPGSVLSPFAHVKIFTNKAELAPGEYSFNSPTAIWHNQGGCGQLLDDQERTVSEYSY